MENKISVVIKQPNKKAQIKQIDNNLKTLQNIVGGYIECVPFAEIKNITLIVNEEGKIHNLESNFVLPFPYQDYVAGTCIFANSKGEDFTSITDKQINKILHFLGE